MERASAAWWAPSPARATNKHRPAPYRLLTDSPLQLPHHHNIVATALLATMVLYYMLYAALAGSAAYVGQMLSPRMLVYKLRIGGLPRLSRSHKGGYKLALSAGVELTNDNLVDLDVHAIAFDFYSPYGRGGSALRHLGTVQNAPSSSKAVSTIADSTSLSSRPFWSVSGQSLFRTKSLVNLSLKVGPFIKSLWRLTRQMLRHGFIEMPTTGVAHVKAASSSNYTAMPITLSIVCDNRVDLSWTGLAITGKSCEMKNIYPGWNDLDQMASTMRQLQLSGAS